MAITITSSVTPGYDWSSGEVVTPTKLDSTADPDVATTITLATDKLLGRVSASTGAVEEVTCTDQAQALLDDASASDMRTTLGLGTIATQAAASVAITGGSVVADTYGTNPTTLSYSGTTNLDFNSGVVDQTLTLAGNITFTTSNLAAGRAKKLRIIGDGSTRTFTFPSWVFVGATAPASLAANKQASLVLFAYGSNNTDVQAIYAAQL